MEDQVVDARENKTDEADFMEEVRGNYRWADTYESENRIAAKDDLEHLKGYHWPEQVKTERTLDGRPVLTINKLPAFVDSVKGDARLNEMQIKVIANHPASKRQKNNKPTELARIYNGLIRHIEQASNANYARLSAFDSALSNAFGFYEIIADYPDDDTFDQELRVRRIKNQFSCLVDPRYIEPDARDAKWWVVSELIRRKEFKVMYPDIEPSNFESNWGDETYSDWVREDMVRVGVYHVKRPFKKKLVSVQEEGESPVTYDATEWDKIKDDLEAKEQIMHFAVNEMGQTELIPGPAPEGSDFKETIVNPAPKVIREREVDSHVVVKYIVDGVQIIDGPRDDSGNIILDFKTEKDIKEETINPITGEIETNYRKFVWPGKYIPIIPIWGKELQEGEKTYRRSLIRFSKDPARMYDYHVTAETERVALNKTPPAILTKKQLGPYQQMWSSQKNLKYLLYEPDGTPGAVPPFFPNPPQASTGNIALIQQATQDQKDTMSIQDPSLGIQGKERSGIAIRAEQRKNEVANFEFIDNLMNAVKLEGDILVDVIPYYYDTEQELLILNEDGSEEFVTINKTVIDEETGEKVILNDMTQGKYLVTVTTGPNSTTQRIETAEALTQLATGVSEPIAQLILIAKVVKNMDWPGATETAETLEKLLPPGLIDTEEDQQQPPGQQPGQPQQGEQQNQDDIVKKLTDAAKLQGQLLTNEEKQLKIDREEAEQGKNVQRLQATLEQLGPLLQQLQGGQ
jgi:hypothetical protein